MNDVSSKDGDSLPVAAELRIDDACQRFEAAWKAGRRPRIEDYLRNAAGEERAALLKELILLEVAYRRTSGEEPLLQEYLDRFSELDRAWLEGTLSAGAAPSSIHQASTESESPGDEEVAAGRSGTSAGVVHVPGYEILGSLGEGGQSVVYKARHLALSRVVALKMVRDAEHAGPEKLARFKTEAKAIARMQHAHIVQIFEVGEQSGLPFFSLEFCPGGNLDTKLNGAPLPAREAAALVEMLAHAMQAAHDKGVLHRDLKPANVLLTEDGTPKITDFGLAKMLGADAKQTRTMAVMGTYGYMAPEQAAGAAKHATFATDVYGLGAILYTTLVGQPPFGGQDWVDVLIQVRSRPPVPPSHTQRGVPAALEGICLKCLEKEPERRYATAGELAEDLRRFLTGEPTRAAADRPAVAPSVAPAVAGDEPTINAMSGASREGGVANERLPVGPARFPTLPGYEILEELGRGGMGVVYKARQHSLKRLVALKTIRGTVQESEWRRLRVEAETVAGLHHPHIVQVYDLGEHAGLVYVAMEYVEGGSLYRLLKGEPQPPRAAVELVEQVAQAIGLAHLRGVVHRDLKPANVLVIAPSKPDGGFPPRAREQARCLYGFPKITDFGLVRRFGKENEEQEGAVMGTPSYMSPEQAAGRVKEISPATDVYALGGIMYEMLTGRPPFRGRTVIDTLNAVMQGEVAPPGRLVKIPRDVEAICLKCLHKDPARRYATGQELADDLRRFLEHRAIVARPVGFWRRLFFRGS